MADTSVSYKCPNCSAPLPFQPGADKAVCEYCGTEFEVSVLEELYRQEEERAAQAAAEQEAKWDTEAIGGEWTEEEAAMLRVFTCSSCGAELVCDENTMATECCYCGNPTLLPNRFDGMLKPDYIIPFKKTKQEAVAALKEFYKGKLLLPSAFTAGNRVEAIQPMYVPFWLFDSDVEAHATFRASKDHRYETSDEIITETKVYECIRGGTMDFELIPVDGSEKMQDDYMDSIEPFDYDELVPFQATYLAGNLADKYDVTAEDSAERADSRVRNSAIGVLDASVRGYDRRELQDSAVIKREGHVQYAMLPVWILTTRYEGKPFTFMMNGQTGKVVGSLPIDKMKSYLYPTIFTAILVPLIFILIQALM